MSQEIDMKELLDKLKGANVLPPFIQAFQKVMDEAVRADKAMVDLEPYMDQLKDHHDRAFEVLTQYASKPLEEISSGIWYAQCFFADIDRILQPFEKEFGLVPSSVSGRKQPEPDPLDIQVALTPAQLAEVIRHDMLTRSEADISFADMHAVDQTMEACVEVLERFRRTKEAKLNLEKRMQLIIDGRDWLRGAHRYRDDEPIQLKGALEEDIRRVNEIPNPEKVA